MFIGTYISANNTNTNWKLETVAPTTAIPPSFPDGIAAISPTFVTIMGQVGVAKAFNLDQLVGIGLRKALEFLIKDFAISEHPTKDEEIRAAWLAEVIKDYVTDARIQACAKRATWLGNDHAHYTKKWETKDVTDLDVLMSLTVNWIHSHLETKKFIGDMPG